MGRPPKNKEIVMTRDQKRAEVNDLLIDAMAQLTDLINEGDTIVAGVLGQLNRAVGKLHYIQPSLGKKLKPTDELPLK
jgi:hypothetical protein